jgi:hypothetical protein
MNTMRIRIVMLFSGLALLAMPHFAGAASGGDPANSALGSLAGTAVSASQLAASRARGDVIVSSVNNGTVSNNTIDGNTTTGAIMNSMSGNDNSGITSIFQNTGNDSLIQNSTAIYISTN